MNGNSISFSAEFKNKCSYISSLPNPLWHAQGSSPPKIYMSIGNKTAICNN